MAATLPPMGPYQAPGEPKGVVFELDDLLSIVELAKSVEAQAQDIAPLDNDNQPFPLRVSIGDATREAWAAHIVIDSVLGNTHVDFTYEERK